MVSNISLAVGFLLISKIHSLVLSVPNPNCSTIFVTNLAKRFSGQTTTIENATYIPANSTAGNKYDYCLVAGTVTYSGNNTLNFQIHLPDPAAYNRRLLAVGNGGMAGTIDTANMLLNLNKGFAVAGCDAGHRAINNNNGNGAPGVYLPYMHDPEQVSAWIHNGISLFTPSAKTIIELYYGYPPKYSYFAGCSTGGAQAFALAQFHPNLFHGIYAGSPGNWYSHLALSFLWNAFKTQGASNIPQTKLDVITAAVLQECDLLDGVLDGMIENPLKCNFDINSLSCSATNSNGSKCLTIEQLKAAKAIYAGPSSSIDERQLYSGFSVGSEASWAPQQGGLADAFSIPILQNVVFDNLDYDFRSFNWGSDVNLVDEKVGQNIDEISTDLSAFRQKRGKLIVTQGWSDALNAATWPIDHLKAMEDFFGGDISDFFNLFMVPGGGHCTAAPNFPASPANYHVIEALVAWVGRDDKPASVLSTGTMFGNGISRKLCPWPQTATYIGGDIHEASSYNCEIS